jgi:hypothetical protein
MSLNWLGTAVHGIFFVYIFRLFIGDAVERLSEHRQGGKVLFAAMKC